MELVVALMIVAIFGVWIYGLKEEISTLQKRVPPEKTLLADAVVQPASSLKNSSSPSHTQTMHRDSVQTWVLE